MHYKTKLMHDLTSEIIKDEELEKSEMELMNLIFWHAQDNGMTFEQIKKCAEKVADSYLKNGILKKAE